MFCFPWWTDDGKNLQRRAVFLGLAMGLRGVHIWLPVQPARKASYFDCLGPVPSELIFEINLAYTSVCCNATALCRHPFCRVLGSDKTRPTVHLKAWKRVLQAGSFQVLGLTSGNLTAAVPNATLAAKRGAAHTISFRIKCAAIYVHVI